jgi:hypothetical protein
MAVDSIVIQVKITKAADWYNLPSKQSKKINDHQ